MKVLLIVAAAATLANGEHHREKKTIFDSIGKSFCVNNDAICDGEGKKFYKKACCKDDTYECTATGEGDVKKCLAKKDSTKDILEAKSLFGNVFCFDDNAQCAGKGTSILKKSCCKSDDHECTATGEGDIKKCLPVKSTKTSEEVEEKTIFDSIGKSFCVDNDAICDGDGKKFYKKACCKDDTYECTATGEGNVKKCTPKKSEKKTIFDSIGKSFCVDNDAICDGDGKKFYKKACCKDSAYACTATGEGNVKKCMPSKTSGSNSKSLRKEIQGPVCNENYSQCGGQNFPNGNCCKDANYECIKDSEYFSQCRPKSNVTPVKNKIGAWGQCGGKGYAGETACIDGWTCKVQNENYSQCVSNSLPSTTAPPNNNAKVTAWGQCGGKGFNGGTVCVDGYYCKSLNEYYSQCSPKPLEGGLATWSQCGGNGYVGRTNCQDQDYCWKKDDWYSQCIPKK